MCVSYTVVYLPTITQAILNSADQAVNPERKISVFPFHKPNIRRKPAVVQVAEQNNRTVAMNHKHRPLSTVYDLLDKSVW